MKVTGIIRRIDDLGRVVIPKELRRTLKIEEGDALEIFTTDSGQVVFQKYYEEDMSKNGFADGTSTDWVSITIKDNYNDEMYYLSLSPSAYALLLWLCDNEMIRDDYEIEDGHNFKIIDF